MVRVVKNPDVRRNEIIDVAQQLFLSKGYDNTSIQDVLDGAGIAKGTFYHYFDSKMALLDSLINRLIDGTLESVKPIVTDDHMSSLEKLDAYFGTVLAWKTSQREFFMDFARVLFRDENAVYRQKMVTAGMQQIAPVFSHILRQGMEEGVFNLPYPVESAEIIYALLRSMSESMTYMLLDTQYEGDLSAAFERVIAAHEHAISRVLGYDGKLELINAETAKKWTEVAASA